MQPPAPVPPSPPTPPPTPANAAKRKQRHRHPYHLSARARDRRLHAKPRLPNGSRVETYYDGLAERWSGWLRIPVADHEWVSFTASGPGLFGLLSHLDSLYRAWLVAHPNTPAAPVAEVKGGAA